MRAYFWTTSLDKLSSSTKGTNSYATHQNFMHAIMTKHSFVAIKNIDY